MAEERCVCCGVIIPEGYQVCKNCEFQTKEEKVRIKFKSFEIQKPAYLGRPPDDYEYRWEVVKWNGQYCFIIASLRWVEKEAWFEFKSCGLRYLEYREAGLEEWILAWCQTQAIAYKYEKEE